MFLFPKTRRPALEYTLYSTHLGDFLQGVNRLGREVKQSPPFMSAVETCSNVQCVTLNVIIWTSIHYCCVRLQFLFLLLTVTFLFPFHDSISFPGPTPHSTSLQKLPHGLQPLDCWDCGLQSCRRHGCPRTECGVSECGRETSKSGGPAPLGAVVLQKSAVTTVNIITTVNQVYVLAIRLTSPWLWHRAIC
jgi:hypothetical protein